MSEADDDLPDDDDPDVVAGMKLLAELRALEHEVIDFAPRASSSEKVYEVHVRRDGRFWFIEIPEIDGATQARHPGEIEEMARDYISLATGEKPADVSIRMIYGRSPETTG